MFLTALCFSAAAQVNDMLPIGFAPGEELLMDSYLDKVMNNQSRASVITTPPTLPVRTAAQWEESQALVIRNFVCSDPTFPII